MFRSSSGELSQKIKGPLRPAAVALMVLLFVCAAIAEARESVDEGPAYAVKIQGAPTEEVEDILLSVSDTASLRDRPPPSLRLLERRAADDLKKMANALDSLGYFKSKIESRVDGKADSPEVVFLVTPGPRFTLSEAHVQAAGADLDADLPTAFKAGLEVGQPYAAKKIVDAQKRLIAILGNRGYPFTEVVRREVVADYGNNSVRVRYFVSPGPRAEFGMTEIKGLETVDKEYARILIPWKQGQTYDVSLVDKARQQFFESGLFSKVEIEHPSELTDGRLPMTIVLAERDHRTASAGLEYNTDYGLGVTFGWEHRNFFGSGESLSTELSFNELKRSLTATLRKPNLYSPNREFVAKTSMADERTEAFTSRSLDVSGIVERKFTDIVTLGYGAGYRYSEIEDKDLDETDTFGHAYFPLTAVRDRRDSILNPTKGYKSGVMLTPYYDTLGGGADFLKYRLDASWYQELMDDGRVILATRALYGAITGARREEVPADLRFYAGGGGTVRGYAFQTAGPLDDEDEPIGGKSMLLGSLELRFKLTERFGVSPFVDAGRAYEDGHPDFDETMFWGAGLGFQYYTGFGPLRIDVAVPLNGRDDVDDPFQLYVSLGHAF